MNEDQTFAMDDVVEIPALPGQQFVLWQKHSTDDSWQVMQVLHLTGEIYTVHFIGFWSPSDLAQATKVGVWSDALKRVVPQEQVHS